MQAIKYMLMAAVAVALLLPASAMAQEGREVKVEIEQGGITFYATVANNGLDISIAGGRGCVDFIESFDGKARIRPEDLVPKGTRPPDGIYNYRASVQPKAAFTILDRNVGRGDREIEGYLKKGHKLAKTWDELPNGEPIVAEIVEGVFGVLEGRIVDPRVVEDQKRSEK